MSSAPPPRPPFSPIGIGSESRAPFAAVPDPVAVFARRAARFAVCGGAGGLAPYLGFLAALTATQAALARSLPPVDPIPADDATRAAGHGMPPIDRNRLRHDTALAATVMRFVETCGRLDLPDAGTAALGALADAARRAQRIADVLEDAVPAEAVAEYVLVAAGVQLHLARLAAGLPADGLVPVAEGTCPACGGPPLASIIVERNAAHGSRFCVCSACATEWNVVRVKCTLCGSTEGIGYQEIAEAADGIQAETCDACRCYVKIFAQNEHPELDATADDVASLGLDLKLADSAWRRGAVNPFLAGY